MVRKVYGVGINDADYNVMIKTEGKKVLCTFYQTWKDVLRRCYSSEYWIKRPNYEGCSVVDEWLYFSNFREWMISQPWQGKQLDKDLLVSGNKIYGPDTCLFVPPKVNMFITEKSATRDLPVGVVKKKNCVGYQAQCRGLDSDTSYIGMFPCPESAHLAYLKRKSELGLELASRQQDNRVRDALIRRYSPNEA